MSSDIHRKELEVPVADVLIRNVPPDDLRRLDEQARRLGLSRADFLRRQLHQQAATTVLRVSLEDLQEVADILSDLSDPKVMDEAWS